MDMKACISKCKLKSISAKYFNVEDVLRKILAEIMWQVYTVHVLCIVSVQFCVVCLSCLLFIGVIIILQHYANYAIHVLLIKMKS